MSVEIIRCKDCAFNWGVTECTIIGECGGEDFFCAYGKKSDTTEWDGMIFKDIVKHHLCLFCEDSFTHIWDMDTERFVEFLKYRYSGTGHSIPYIPIDISGAADGFVFNFPEKRAKITVPWEMAAEYLKTWADESSLECSSTFMSVGSYFYERLCVNGHNSGVREKIYRKALDYGVTQELIEKAWDFWKCGISRLDKAMVAEYIAQTS